MSPVLLLAVISIVPCRWPTISPASLTLHTWVSLRTAHVHLAIVLCAIPSLHVLYTVYLYHSCFLPVHVFLYLDSLHCPMCWFYNCTWYTLMFFQLGMHQYHFSDWVQVCFWYLSIPIPKWVKYIRDIREHSA